MPTPEEIPAVLSQYTAAQIEEDPILKYLRDLPNSRKRAIMNNQLQQYVSPDVEFNASYADVKKLISRLRVVGIAITDVNVEPNPGNAPFITVQQARDLGMMDTDLLNYVIQVNNVDSWHTASLVAIELAPLTAVALYKVLSDLEPGNAQAALGTALMMLPGIDKLIATELA